MSAVTQTLEWATLPYNSKKFSTHYLVSNFLGCWDFLTPEEFRRLEQFAVEEGDSLFQRLYDKGLIVREENVSDLIAGYRNLNANLFMDTSLHMPVLTTRCNIACSYCHAATNSPSDMTPETASQILNYLFKVRSQNITLELQGGEPLLKWDLAKFFVENARKFNTTGKTINICIVTNGTLLTQDKIDFFLDNDVSICISLDGPQHVHDSNRVYHQGTGSYKLATAAIKRLKDTYKKRGIKRPADLLPTFTRQNLKHIKEVIDEHVKWGVESIAVRAINKVGAADGNWGKIGATPEEFNRAWAEGMNTFWS